jgi:hypothetical protein
VSNAELQAALADGNRSLLTDGDLQAGRAKRSSTCRRA